MLTDDRDDHQRPKSGQDVFNPPGTSFMMQRRLRNAIRELRVGADLSRREVAAELEWSESKLSRLEHGDTPITVANLLALLRHYGAPQDMAKQLTHLARMSRQKSWQSNYRRYADPEFLRLLGYEESAAHIRRYQSIIIPSPVQISAYARYVTSTVYDDPEFAARMADLNTARWESWERLVNDRRIEMILDESALHRRIDTCSTMAKQLKQLQWFGRRENIELRVLPLNVDVQVAAVDSYHILDFAHPDDSPVVFIENALDSAAGNVAYRDDPHDLAEYVERFDEAVRHALKPTESLDLIERRREAYRACECDRSDHAESISRDDRQSRERAGS
jgi:transcriptional regulator with XRE-family HTH domain